MPQNIVFVQYFLVLMQQLINTNKLKSISIQIH